MSWRKLKVILVLALVAIAVIVGLIRPASLATPALAKPAYMDRYNRDPYAKPELMKKCTVCHVERGGGDRNNFGEAFADASYRITPKMREKFPQLFARVPREPSGGGPKP